MVAGAPAAVAAAASPTTVKLAILHVLRGCHVWNVSKAPAVKLTLKVGDRLASRPTCPMHFDFRQVGGPRLAFGDPRVLAGTSRVVVFRRPGVYRRPATNVQTSADVGLQTLGADNVLTLTVIVR